MTGSTIAKELRAKMAAVFGTLFCRRCQKYQPVEGGKWRKDARGAKRWDCARCLAAVAEAEANRK